MHETLYEQAYKQSYYLKSLSYVVTIFFSVSCIKQTNNFFQFFFHIYCIHYLFSQRFFYVMMIKLPKVKNNLFKVYESPMILHYFKKHVFSKNCYGNKKEE